ncbi:50S ribosomal protein L3 [Magnetococcales bacterium HHB-1]
MRSGLIGRKLGMTQLFQEDGDCWPVTVIQLGPCSVVAKKTEGKDCCNAIQLGFEDAKASRVSKPLRGEFAKAGVAPKRVLREFRVDNLEDYKVGQELTAEQFEQGQFVDVIGTSIGKGFAGVVKRWGFRGGRASHGAHKIHRSPGSIGQCQTPGRVFKNKKMPGRMGGDRVTAQNLRVAMVDAEKHLLVVKGTVPGPKGGMVMVQDAKKKVSQGKKAKG